MSGWAMVTCELTAYGARAHNVWVNITPSQVMYLVGPGVISWLPPDKSCFIRMFLSFVVYIFIDPSLFLSRC